MGPASVAFSNAMVKMSRLQAAQARPRPGRPPAGRAAGVCPLTGDDGCLLQAAADTAILCFLASLGDARTVVRSTGYAPWAAPHSPVCASAWMCTDCCWWARRARGRGGAQVYAASVMFGYFVRRVDKRFHLERSLGLLQEAPEDAVKRLERLFSQARAPHRVGYWGSPCARALTVPSAACGAPGRLGRLAARAPPRAEGRCVCRDQGEGGCQDAGWHVLLT